MSSRSRRACKSIDYSQLHNIGYVDSMGEHEDSTRSKSLLERSESPVEFVEHSHDLGTMDHLQGAYANRSSVTETKQFIDAMNDELEKLQLEEDRLRLALKLDEKRKAIQHLQDIRADKTRTSPHPSTPDQPVAPADRYGPTARAAADPQIYLQGKVASVKYRKIVEYLPQRSRHVDEEIKVGEGLFVKLDKGKAMKAENVSPSQWIIGNASILAEILDECEVSEATANFTKDYLSYTAKIGDLGGRFTWQSVMLYDDEYRSLQSRYGFRWGTDSNHLSTVILTPREQKPVGKKSKMNHNSKTCGYYNMGKECPHEPHCKFAHVCEICRKTHPKIACTDRKEPQLTE